MMAPLHHHHLRRGDSALLADAFFERDVVAAQQSKQDENSSRIGRVLQDGTCLCSNDDNNNNNNNEESNNNNKELITVRMLAVGGDGHYLNFVPNRFKKRVPAFYNRTGINVQVLGLGDLENLNQEIFADVQAKVYDGFIFLPFMTGSLVERDGLADLTEFVRSNQDVAWTDIFPFNRDMQSVYDNVVRVLPCDGDVHSLFYRKDLFEQFNRTVPRTWDEYTDTAAFFHGRQVPAGDGSNRTVTLSGSCVERKRKCHEPYYFNMLVHSTSTQAGGTRHGSLLDPHTFQPLMGEAMAETLRHLENQVKYGASDELEGDSCTGLNIERMNAGTCAMTYFWGDIFARHLLDGSVLEGKLGIAPTPGVTKILDRATGKLVECTEELCPHGETIADLGRINRAPYAAAGGWSAGVSGGVSRERQEAMASFFGYVCGKDESVHDVIPYARGDGDDITGTDPYRKSHFDIEKWVEQGYPRDTSILYQKTIEEQLSSPNTVLDVRFPDANKFLDAMHQLIYDHLNESTRRDKTHEDRMAVSDQITKAWVAITREYDNHEDTVLPLKSIYQKSLNVYTPPSEDDSRLSTGSISGIVVGCSVFVALITGMLSYLLIKRERKKHSTQWLIKREDLRLTSEILGEGSYGVIVKAHIRGTPVAVKHVRHTMDRMDSGGLGGSTVDSTSHATSKLTQTQLREDLSALIKLRNPNIVQIMGAMVDKKTTFLVMEFMEYGSLSSVLSDPAGIAANEGYREIEMQWAIQIARGLEYLHTMPSPVGPLLHTELRASNILIDSSYNAKITNFALESRVVGSTRDQGYLLWTAPEVLNGSPCSQSSDVYAFAMVLFEIVAKSRPFRVRCFSSTNLTEYTMSTMTNPDEDIVPSAFLNPSSVAFGGRAVEYFGVFRGEKKTVPEIVSLVSDVTVEPPVRPDLPDRTPLNVRDICVECWNKNPSRRPTISEIVDRLSRVVSPSSLTKQLVQRSSVFDTILPPHVQDMLARNETVPPQSYANVTVIFSDVVGFTSTSSLLTAEEVGDLIRRLFTQYDELAVKYGIKKLDVIGDAFLGVAGIPNEEPDHAIRAAAFALEAVEEANQTPICLSKPHLGNVSIRFGLATGPCVATVIGSAHHPKFTLFGTTVNTASRMESCSEANRVQCTVETCNLLKEQAPNIGVHFRKKMEIKGRGELETYFLSPPEDGFKSIKKLLAFNQKNLRRQRSGQGSARRSMGPIRMNSSGRYSSSEIIEETVISEGENSE